MLKFRFTLIGILLGGVNDTLVYNFGIAGSRTVLAVLCALCLGAIIVRFRHGRRDPPS